MAIIFATNSLYAFNSWTSATEEATSGYYDSAYVSFQIELNSGTITSNSFGALSEAWLHYEWAAPGFSNNTAILTWYNSSGVAVVRLYKVTANYLLQWWDGGTWNTIGTGYAGFTADTRFQIDLHVKVNGASSELDWYVNKAAVDTGVGNYSAISDIDYFEFQGTGGSGAYRARITQVILADESTLNFKYSQNLPTGNSGTNTAWTGSYTDIDEFPVNPADFISSGTANQVSTFTAAARTWTGVDVKAVVLDYYPLKGNSGPQQIQTAFRIGSTNYFGSTRTLLHGFKGIQDIYDTDPSTGVTWAAAAAADATLEFGVKSIT